MRVWWVIDWLIDYLQRERNLKLNEREKIHEFTLADDLVLDCRLWRLIMYWRGGCFEAVTKLSQVKPSQAKSAIVRCKANISHCLLNVMWANEWMNEWMGEWVRVCKWMCMCMCVYLHKQFDRLKIFSSEWAGAWALILSRARVALLWRNRVIQQYNVSTEANIDWLTTFTYYYKQQTHHSSCTSTSTKEIILAFAFFH